MGECVGCLPYRCSLDTRVRFFGRPTVTGWGTEHTARAWVVLMKRLGYKQFVAQGGDLGSVVTTLMGEQAAPELLGIHTSLPATVPPAIAKSLASGDPAPGDLSADEKHAYEQLQLLYGKQFAYAAFMHTRPQTLYGLADSPVGLAAWLLDHGDGNGQPAAAVISALAGHTIDGHSAGDLTRDDVLDNITLYWLTNTGISAARSYRKIRPARSTPPTSPSRLPQPCSPTRSMRLRAVGRSSRFTSSSISIRRKRAVTLQPGSSRKSFPKRFALVFDRCDKRDVARMQGAAHRRHGWARAMGRRNG